MGSNVAGGGFRFSQISVGGTWYWSVTADNIQGANQLFYVRDIETPFGKITDGVDVPIPGDVVVSMAASMSQFQQQLAPLLALVSGQQTTITVTVTQGDPALQVGGINVINVGAFGSFMTATATGTVPWLSASPTTVPGIGQNQQATFGLILDPTTLQTAPVPYTAQINFQDNRATPTIIPVSIVVNVLPQPIIQVNTTAIGLSWVLETGANSGSAQLTVTNAGPPSSILSFTVAKVQNCSPWLAFSPISAIGITSGQSAIITFNLVGSGIPQIPGTFFETILISSVNASNSPIAVQICLNVLDADCDDDEAVEWEGGHYDRPFSGYIDRVPGAEPPETPPIPSVPGPPWLPGGPIPPWPGGPPSSDGD